MIVDAADSVPPLARLRQLYDDGADLITISGGKAFRGPQASGILCGRADLIRHVALHHLDMDLRDATWNASEVTGYWPTGGREGIGRGMKVGREQIVGLLTAVKEFATTPTGGQSITARNSARVSTPWLLAIPCACHTSTTT